MDGHFKLSYSTAILKRKDCEQQAEVQKSMLVEIIWGHGSGGVTVRRLGFPQPTTRRISLSVQHSIHVNNFDYNRQSSEPSSSNGS